MNSVASEADEALLQRRAAELARRPPAPAPADRLEVLAFSAGGQDCALPLAFLREVRPLRELTPLPLAVPPVAGLLHLRGHMLPVLDLAQVLGLSGPGGSACSQLLVTGRQVPLFGLAIGAVQGLQEVSEGEARHRSASLEKLRPELVLGVDASGRLLLDGEGLLGLASWGWRGAPAAVEGVRSPPT